MNPITLPMAELKPALAGLGKIITRRPTLPVLGCIRVERTDTGRIELTGTDLLPSIFEVSIWTTGTVSFCHTSERSLIFPTVKRAIPTQVGKSGARNRWKRDRTGHLHTGGEIDFTLPPMEREGGPSPRRCLQTTSRHRPPGTEAESEAPCFDFGSPKKTASILSSQSFLESEEG